MRGVRASRPVLLLVVLISWPNEREGTIQMRVIGAFKAKNTLGARLDTAERGPAGRLLGSCDPSEVLDRAAAKAMAARIRKRCKGTLNLAMTTSPPSTIN